MSHAPCRAQSALMCCLAVRTHVAHAETTHGKSARDWVGAPLLCTAIQALGRVSCRTDQPPHFHSRRWSGVFSCTWAVLFLMH